MKKSTEPFVKDCQKEKKLEVKVDVEQLGTDIATPKFNNGSFLGRGRVDSWSEILEETSPLEKEEEHADYNHSK